MLQKFFKKKCHKIIVNSPKPFQEIGAEFNLIGYVPKGWLLTTFETIDDRIFSEYIDIDGKTFMGGTIYIRHSRSIFSLFRKRYIFGQIEKFMWANIGFLEKSQGHVTLKICGHDEDKHAIFIPLIVKEFEPAGGVDPEILKKHANVGNKITQFRKDIKNYYKELSEIRKSFPHNQEDLKTEDAHINVREVTYGVFEILGKSEVVDENSPYVKERREKEALEEKYKDALEWRGPLVGASLFRIDGFLFKIHSHDHGKHLHIIHKGRGVDVRFSFPELEILSYKNIHTILSSKEVKNIQEFLRKEDNFKKLKEEFIRRDNNLMPS